MTLRSSAFISLCLILHETDEGISAFNLTLVLLVKFKQYRLDSISAIYVIGITIYRKTCVLYVIE